MAELYEALMRLSGGDLYPFHMPGHKRALTDPFLKEASALDITEICGFGNLYENEGILEELKEEAARLYGAKRAFLLVNGSTVGVLSALHAALRPGGKLLMAKNSHRSAYNAASLLGAGLCFFRQERIEPYGIFGAVTPEAVEEALNRETGVEAVFLTSPSYEGLLSDVRSIAELCHGRDIPLIVDSAHGAHLGFDKKAEEEWHAPNAVGEGADVVIESLHKTLPSLTQTALMFSCSDRVSPEALGDFLFKFQTSSPSYLLMAGMERCFRFLETGEAAFREMYRRLKVFRRDLDALRNLRLFGPELIGKYGISGFDPSRLLIYAGGEGGFRLTGLLRERYRIEMELSAESYCLGIATVMDTEEGFIRLAEALKELDKSAPS
ncbi:MAG: aminotransferase class I/II-fold pyridoxal phosphate-dependent enzyme [Lachnospiraceae bacterium]|nr:aminotransferase class I/II-fold pyridoxal phosphate-dependent enzyme [Lachnospiraceae bacterium]